MPPSTFLLWLLLIWSIGWLALPFTTGFWRGKEQAIVADAGIAAGRVGVLTLWSLAAFWLGHLGVPTRFSSFLVYFFAAFAVWFWWRKRSELLELLRAQRRGVVAGECALFAVFALFFLLRGFWPAIDNGEKPMDMALISACARANFLPPPNPYAAGERLASYYYLGHLQTALLTDAIGAQPRWTYNLMCATLPALCISTLVSLASGITGSLRSGALASLAVLACGTLEPWRQWLVRWKQTGGDNAFSLWPINYWDTSRVIPYYHTDGPHYAITEYPWFTFNYGDLHAHYFAQPVALLLISLGWAAANRGSESKALTVRLTLTAAAVLGALVVTNTWDYPIYALLTVIAAPIAARFAKRLKGRALFGATLGVVSLGLAAPFLLSLHSAANPPRALEQPASPLFDWLLVWGLFLTLWAMALWKHSRPTSAQVILATAIYATTWWFCGQPAYVLTIILLSLAWTWLSLRNTEDETHAFLCKVALCGLLALLWSETTWAGFLDKPNHRQDTIFKFGLQTWYLLGTAALCGALRCVHQWRGQRTWWQPFARSGLALLLFAPLVCTLAVPLARTRSRLISREEVQIMKQQQYLPGTRPPLVFDFRTFGVLSERWDGWDPWVHLTPAERNAAAWLQRSAADGDNLVEAEQEKGGDYTEFTRYAHLTGVPTVIGPQAHTFQWGLDWEKVFERKRDVRVFYLSGHLADTGRTRFLKKYGVKFIVIGALERQEYGDNAMAWLERALIMSGFTAVTFTGADYDDQRVTVFYRSTT